MQASDKLGENTAKGLNINIPFSRSKSYSGSKCRDEEFLYATETVLPILKMFNPSFVIISAGFDAARCDPVGGYEVSPENGYPGMLKRILSVCEPNVRTLLILEGGYNLDMIGKCTVSCLEFLVKYYGKNQVGNQVKLDENIERETKSEVFDYTYKETLVQSLQEFALHNLEEVLTNLIPIWDIILGGCLAGRLKTIRTEIIKREEKRNAPVVPGLRRSPRKNSKKRRKSSENGEHNEVQNEQLDKVYEKQNSTESLKSESSKSEKPKTENSKTDNFNDFQSPDLVHNLSKSFSQASINPEF